MTDAAQLAVVEAAYLAARDARDRLDVARASGETGLDRLERAAADSEAAAREALAAVGDAGPASAADTLPDEDRRAMAVIRAWLANPDAASEGTAGPTTELEDRYAAAAAAVRVGGETLTRLQVLGRLATEADPAARRRLFLALEPLWRAVDGDGIDSPYRWLLRESALRWSVGRSPIDANAAALGVTASDIEAWAVTTLEAWRDAVVEPARARGEPPTQPWDWWWRAGEADRALRPWLPLPRLFELDAAVHRTLGADLEALGVRLDTSPRPGRPPVAVAYTTFGGRPHRRPGGPWDPGRPTVFANYTDGGLGELTELVHETGHAIHIAAIRTRPAFADWPDSDALTEAFAELVALDTAEPAWRRRWLPDAPDVPEAVSLRCRYADVALDAAWALLEIRLHADPGRSPSEAWADLTGRYLGIAPHAEWPWWAMRGQLAQEPGYMANYAIGAVIAADLRAAIREARGDWTEGDPGWYGWVSERLFRFGLERPAGTVLREVLGRAPAADALLREVARAGAAP